MDRCSNWGCMAGGEKSRSEIRRAKEKAPMGALLVLAALLLYFGSYLLQFFASPGCCFQREIVVSLGLATDISWW